MFRLSCAIEENGLLAIGADNTEGLFVSSGYFGSLESDANMAFRERYHNHFGQRAPTLNALGQSTYEGVHFMLVLWLVLRYTRVGLVARGARARP